MVVLFTATLILQLAAGLGSSIKDSGDGQLRVAVSPTGIEAVEEVCDCEWVDGKGAKGARESCAPHANDDSRCWRVCCTEVSPAEDDGIERAATGVITERIVNGLTLQTSKPPMCGTGSCGNTGTVGCSGDLPATLIEKFKETAENEAIFATWPAHSACLGNQPATKRGAIDTGAFCDPCIPLFDNYAVHKEAGGDSNRDVTIPQSYFSGKDFNIYCKRATDGSLKCKPSSAGAGFSKAAEEYMPKCDKANAADTAYGGWNSGHEKFRKCERR